MALPKLTTPEFYTKLPSTDQTIAFRPFLVKEEKILLMAQQGKDQQEIQNAVFKILESCVLTPLKVMELPTYDVEWLFLQLRAKSVGEIIELKLKHYQDPECNGETDVDINIEDIAVSKPENYSNVIDIDGNVGITMKAPSLNMIKTSGTDFAQPSLKDMFDILEKCIVNVYDKDQVYNDFTPNELSEFLEGLDQKQFTKVVNFFDNSPKIVHEVKYKCSKCGKDVEHQLKGLMDFFS